MSTTDLITSLTTQDIRLSAKGDKLRVEAPANLLSPDLLTLLTSRKAELLAVLAGDYLNAVVTPATAAVPSEPSEPVASRGPTPLPEAVPFDDLDLPGPACPACPRCGSLEEWIDLLGGRHCGICEPGTLGKAAGIGSPSPENQEQKAMNEYKLRSYARKFARENAGRACVRCGRPAYNVGAFLPDESASRELRVTPNVQAVFFYLACDSCVGTHGDELRMQAEEVAMNTRAGLETNQN